MKYKDLKIGDWFASTAHVGRKLMKSKHKKGTCCTPAFNTKAGNGDRLLINPEQEVELKPEWKPK